MIGYPYLVRLNPNIPWKTRGNGAISLNFNRNLENSGNEKYIIGSHSPGSITYSYKLNKTKHQSSKIANNDTNKTELIEGLVRVEEIIKNNAELNDDNTNPGIVVTDDFGLPLDLYWSAVRSVVDLNELKKKLYSNNAIFKGFKKGRGIIGASAAIAWASNLIKYVKTTKKGQKYALDNTFELITYREQNRFGTKRKIDLEAVKTLDERFPTTFNNYDPETNHITISPNSPCPVLFGVRADITDNVPVELYNVLTYLRPHSEPIDSWQIFRTNQGTDDHLIKTRITEIKPYSSIIVTGRVKDSAWYIKGGHVFFELEENLNNNKKSTITFTCAAYEPTKSFRNVIKELIPGDIITVYGGVKRKPMAINIEKLEIKHLVQNYVKLGNPKCPDCGRGMKSIGRAMGFRCKRCHIKIPFEQVQFINKPRTLTHRFYEVPVSARRHLSKPLKRFKDWSGSIKSSPKGF